MAGAEPAWHLVRREPAGSASISAGRRDGAVREHGRVGRMRVVNRRRFFSSRDGSVAATMLSDIIAKALAVPGNHATRSIKDVEHIVVLM
jgi:hypothetical protein